MLSQIKQYKSYFIYETIIALLSAIVYIKPYDANLAFFWIFIIEFPIYIVETFIAGPIFGFKFQLKYSMSLKNILKFSAVVFFTTYITIYIPMFPYTSFKDFISLQWIYPLLFTVPKSLLFIITSIITRYLLLKQKNNDVELSQ